MIAEIAVIKTLKSCLDYHAIVNSFGKSMCRLANSRAYHRLRLDMLLSSVSTAETFWY